ncbi:MAG: hypothetical protein V4679_19545, partial [Pseudomonadota bacterium]
KRKLLRRRAHIPASALNKCTQQPKPKSRKNIHPTAKEQKKARTKAGNLLAQGRHRLRVGRQKNHSAAPKKRV